MRPLKLPKDVPTKEMIMQQRRQNSSAMISKDFTHATSQSAMDFSTTLNNCQSQMTIKDSKNSNLLAQRYRNLRVSSQSMPTVDENVKGPTPVHRSVSQNEPTPEIKKQTEVLRSLAKRRIEKNRSVMQNALNVSRQLFHPDLGNVPRDEVPKDIIEEN